MKHSTIMERAERLSALYDVYLREKDGKERKQADVYAICEKINQRKAAEMEADGARIVELEKRGPSAELRQARQNLADYLSNANGRRSYYFARGIGRYDLEKEVERLEALPSEQDPELTALLAKTYPPTEDELRALRETQSSELGKNYDDHAVFELHTEANACIRALKTLVNRLDAELKLGTDFGCGDAIRRAERAITREEA